MSDIKKFLLIAIGAVSGYLFHLIQIILYSTRVDNKTATKLFHHIKASKARRLVIHDAFLTKPMAVPQVELSYVWLKFPFRFELEERLMHAGYSAKENVATVTTPRIFRKSLLRLLKEVTREQPATPEIKVHLGMGWRGFVPVNVLEKARHGFEWVMLEEATKRDLLATVDQFNLGNRRKLGLLLFGSPGNGKTSVAKALACHYNYDVYAPILTSEMTNIDIINLFLEIPTDRRTLVLFEDFDNVFHGRKPAWKGCKFSIDVILNLLDGMYINVDNMLFVMTANDIEKVDRALKHRPSRFDLVSRIDDPSYENRLMILRAHATNGIAERLAELTDRRSAAVVAEVAKRKLVASDNLEAEVAKILETFH